MTASESDDRPDSPGQEETACRRCGGRFTVSGKTGRLLVCPHCGASITPWIQHWRSNKNAAALAFVALIVFVPAVLLPFMSIVKLGRTESYSLLGGVRQLFVDRQYFLATIIFVFSFVFPLAKLLFLLVSTSSLVRISSGTRVFLHRVAEHSAKYSMLDVFVLAVLVTVIKFGETTEVHVRSGTVLFCVAIFISILAATCVDVAEPEPRRG